MGLKVIGAGLPRTGTASLKVALQILLKGRCYHMSELHDHPEHWRYWGAAAKGEAINWEELFSGYSAAVDGPTCFFWPELMREYPDALIVLSIRDADSWFDSWQQTVRKSAVQRDIRARPAGRGETPINATHATEEHRPGMAARPAAMHARMPYRRDGSREEVIRGFEKHNSAVRTGVPPERLVVWRPSDGWAPLCAALGMPVPDEPFPHLNSRRTFRARKLLEVLLGRHLADRAVQLVERTRHKYVRWS